MSNNSVDVRAVESRLMSSESSHHFERETKTQRRHSFMSPSQIDNQINRMETPPKTLLQTATSTPSPKREVKLLEQSQVILLPPVYGGDVMRYYVKYQLSSSQAPNKPMKRLSQTGSISDISYSRMMENANESENINGDESIIQQLSSISINNSENGENEDPEAKAMKQLKKQFQKYQKISLKAQQLGDYEESIQFLAKSLEIIEHISPERESGKISIYIKLAELYWKLQMTNQALHFYSKTLLHLLPNPVENNQQISNLYLYIAKIYEQRGQPERTIFYCLKSIQVRKLYHTKPHAEISHTLNNLGLLQWKLKQYKAALMHYCEALQINEAVYGHNHPEVARNYYNIALCLFDIDDYDQWLDCHYESLRIMKFIHLDTHPDFHFWLKWFKNKVKQLIISERYTSQLIFKCLNMTTVLLNKDEEIEFLENIQQSMEVIPS